MTAYMLHKFMPAKVTHQHMTMRVEYVYLGKPTYDQTEIYRWGDLWGADD